MGPREDIPQKMVGTRWLWSSELARNPCYKTPSWASCTKLGKSEREAPKGEGGRPQEATLEKAQCLQL